MDVIDRQAVRLIEIDDKSARNYRTYNLDDAYDDGFYDAISAVLELPSAEPERKKGKWYKPTGMMPPEYVGVYRCSECDGLAMRDWKTHKQKLTDFCPNCGADMRGEQNE